MNNINQLLNETRVKKSGYLLAGLFVLCSPLWLAGNVFAEKHAHEDEHQEEISHTIDKYNEKHDDRANHKDEHNNKKDTHKDGKGKTAKHEEGEEDGHGHGEASTDVELGKEQMQKAGIETMRLEKRSISNQVTALSEVKLNQYRTIKVSPPLTTRIEKRHVHLGDRIEKGRLLVTLHTISTPDMSANLSADKLSRADINASITTTIAEMEANIAEAQGELTAANATWNRLRSLGKDAVSGKRYTAAKIASDQAAAKLKAYKRSRAKIKNLGKPKAKPSLFAKKHYKLRAEQSGMVIKDDFVLGQIVNPEDVLFVISDMQHLWVEANIKPKDVSNIAIGSTATVTAEGKSIAGKVVFIGRILDEKTRTLPVRIEINTKGVALYPGQFVKTSISSKTIQVAIAIPAEAVLRGSDGDWMLFVEEAAGRFVPREVEIIKNLGETVVVEGVEAGTTIVSKGAFAVQSELAKSGFSVHNH